MKKFAVTLALLIGIIVLIALPCLAAEEKAPAPQKKMAAKAAAAKTPVVKLERVEVASYWGYWFDLNEKRGAPLNLAFVFSMDNPNNFKVTLENLTFTVAFEGFQLNISNFYEQNSIPAKTTDHFRYNAVLDAWISNTTLNVQNGPKLKEMNVTSIDLLKKWWTAIGDFTFPVSVNGTGTFVGPDGKNIIVPFEGTFPPK
jgi:hypothetical protein